MFLLCSLLTQTGENLVPEQKNEREEIEKREAAVLQRVPPVLMDK